MLELFENYDSIFVGNDNKKFNKNLVLMSIREMTNLSTKEIRLSMKKYKKTKKKQIEKCLMKIFHKHWRTDLTWFII